MRLSAAWELGKSLPQHTRLMIEELRRLLLLRLIHFFGPDAAR